MTDILDKLAAGDVDLDALFDDVDVIPSAGLDVTIFKGDKLDALQDIPFIVTGGTFREAISRDGQKKTDFVTLLCLLPSKEFLEKRRVRYTETELWFPGQTFGINDGSTGIRRQIVSHLHSKGMIQVVEEGSVISEDGPRGDCTWDMLVSEWNKPGIDDIPMKNDKRTGLDLAVWDFSLEKPLMANRGIRVSTYMGPYRKEITTRYLQ